MAHSTLSKTVALHKTETEGLFYGVVIQPDIPDSQEDVFSAQDVEAACHGFMRDYALAKGEHSPDVNHSGRDADADLLENYVAAQDMVLGGEPVVRGSWVQVWKVNCPLTKREIDNGELTGLSLEGTGFRHSMEV